MAQNITAGYQLGEKLMEALGIEGDALRIVLDCPADGIATVYVQRPLDAAEVAPLLDALEQVSDAPRIVEARKIEIDEKGRVRAE